MRERVHVEELLDAGTGSDRDVALSMADLQRMNRWLGGRRVLRVLLREQVKRAGLTQFSLLDVATGSADLPGLVRKWYPRSFVAGLDLKLRHLQSRNGVPVVCGDLFSAPFPPRSFDFVTATLFAHHFTDDELPALLRAMAALARRALLISDLDRHWFPFYFIQAAWFLFARSPITQFDAPASIARGFRAGELERAARAAGFTRFRTRWHTPFRRSLVIEL